jgi:hypothetical protein
MVDRLRSGPGTAAGLAVLVAVPVAVLVAALVAVLLAGAFVGTASAQRGTPPNPAAQDVSAAQLQSLAERAVVDPRALADLRAVRQVDGRPVDVGRALSGAEGGALVARLRTLAAGGPPAPPGVVASEARRDAAAVLDGRRFKPSPVPRPFAGVLRTLGRWLEPAASPLADLWARISRSLGAQLAFAAVVFAVAVGISVWLVGRRSPRSIRRSEHDGIDAEGLDPEELEREAMAAEHSGELDRAVRLRFVAGVLRLDHAGVIAYRSSTTTGQLRGKLASGSFAELAAAFDEIAYGGRPADEADVRIAKTGWPRVLAEAGR